jgi:hypothetical protein
VALYDPGVRTGLTLYCPEKSLIVENCCSNPELENKIIHDVFDNGAANGWTDAQQRKILYNQLNYFLTGIDNIHNEAMKLDWCLRALKRLQDKKNIPQDKLHKHRNNIYNLKNQAYRIREKIFNKVRDLTSIEII